MRFRLSLQCMAASEIADMIPAETMREIKKVDPSPVFKAFVVAHEGEARGNLIGVGNVVKKWYRAIVEKLHEKITAGLQLFFGHAATNEHAGRESIGRVVGAKLMTINGRQSSVVTCYIEPAHRKKTLDVASIEANVDMEIDKHGQIVVSGVDDVTGIALGNSEIETPGFPGATLLGQLQAFAEKLGPIAIGYEIPPELGFRINNSNRPN